MTSWREWALGGGGATVLASLTAWLTRRPRERADVASIHTATAAQVVTLVRAEMAEQVERIAEQGDRIGLLERAATAKGERIARLEKAAEQDHELILALREWIREAHEVTAVNDADHRARGGTPRPLPDLPEVAQVTRDSGWHPR